MELFSFLSFLSFVVSLLFGGFIFLKSKKSYTNKIFFWMCISASLLSFSEYELRMSESFDRAWFWMKVYSIWPLILALLYHFIYALDKKVNFKSVSTLVIYLPAFAIMLVEFFTSWVTVEPIKVYWGWSFRYDLNFVSVITAFWGIAILVLGVYHSINYYFNSKGQIRKQAYYIFIGYSLNAIVSVLFDILLPGFEFSVPELGNSFGSVLLIILGYAIWKYQLFEIKPESLAGKIVTTISDALFFVDSKLGIIEVNRSTLRLLKYEKDELLGQPVDIIINQSENSLQGERIFELLNAQKRVDDLEVTLRTKENKLIPVSLSASLVRYENRKKQGAIFLCRDITERKRIWENLMQSEFELRKLNASKDKYFSIVAHDLKNPFHAIVSSAGLLNCSYEELNDRERKELVSYIDESSKNIYNLLENLLTWSRSQQGNIVCNPQPLNLNDVISENVLPLRAKAQNKNISLIVEVDTDVIVKVDRDMFSTVLRNLISNAIKFTPNDGFVKVFAKSENGHDRSVRISVEDNGVGIKNEDLKNLFLIGRARSTIGTNNESGTGLGLILCKEFTERLGSEIHVVSKEGKGSRFYFSLEKIIMN